MLAQPDRAGRDSKKKQSPAPYARHLTPDRLARCATLFKSLPHPPDAQDQRLLDALLDSWDRNNTVVVNLLLAVTEGG